MSGTKHTPGPWGFINQGPREVRLKRDHWAVGATDSRKGVAIAFGDDDANARLIAAAPDLLAACQRVLTHESVELCDCGEPDCATTLLRAAIAKATLP